jgi:hypothetical protein
VHSFTTYALIIRKAILAIPLIPEAEIQRVTLPIKGEETNNIDISVFTTSKPISKPFGSFIFRFKPRVIKTAVVGGGTVIITRAFCESIRFFLFIKKFVGI